MSWLLKWVSHRLSCNNYRFPLWFFARQLPQQLRSGLAERLSQGFKSEAAQPFPVLWRIFPLAPRHHGNLVMASLPRWWHLVLCPASAGLKGCCCYSLCVSTSRAYPSQQCAAGGVLGCAGCCTACVCAQLKEWNQTKVILEQLCAWVSPSGYLQTRVKWRVLRTKPDLQLPQFLKTRGSFQKLIESGSVSQEFAFRNLPSRHSGELRLPGAQADGLLPHATGVAMGRARGSWFEASWVFLSPGCGWAQGMVCRSWFH